eukprot:gene10338-5776_t
MDADSSSCPSESSSADPAFDPYDPIIEDRGFGDDAEAEHSLPDPCHVSQDPGDILGAVEVDDLDEIALGDLEQEAHELEDKFLEEVWKARSSTALEEEPSSLFRSAQFKLCPPPCFTHRVVPSAPLSLSHKVAHGPPRSLRVLSWNTENGIGADRDKLASLARWRQPDIIALQEAPILGRMLTPEGYAIPDELRAAARNHGSQGSRCPILVKEGLHKMVTGSHVYGAPHRGYYARVTLLGAGGVVHLINAHPPVHGSPAHIFDEWAANMEKDLDSSVLPDEVTIIAGDLNFSFHGESGYTAGKCAAWLDEDSRRAAVLAALGLSPNPEVHPLTRTQPGTSERSAYDYFLCRGLSPPRMRVHGRWLGMKSDHQPVEADFDCETTLPPAEAVCRKPSIPRRASSAHPRHRNPYFDSCVQDTDQCLADLPEGDVSGGNLQSLISAMSDTLAKHSRTSTFRPRPSAHTEIQRMLGWARVADELFAEEARGQAGAINARRLAHHKGHLAPLFNWMPCLMTWDTPNWNAVASLLRGWASSLRQSIQRFDRLHRQQQFVSFHSDSAWAWRTISARLGRPAPKAVDRVVLPVEQAIPAVATMRSCFLD